MIWPGTALLLVGAILAAIGGDMAHGDVRTGGFVAMVAGGLLLIVGIVRLNHGRRAGASAAAGGRRDPIRTRYRRRVQEQMYRTSKGKTIAMIVAVIYILSPVDIVPDFLLPVGIIDDATAFTWLLFAIGQEVSRRHRNALPPPPR